MADVNTPPPGGFQNGGWYWDPSINQAKQYFNGSFGAGTTINNPNQQGYGQQVSQEVQKQSGYVAPGTGGAPADTGGGGGSPSGPSKPSIDVNSVYSASFNTPDIQAANKAIADKQAEINSRQKQQTDAEAQINDNPYYSEATRVGKVNSLREKANADITNLTNELGGFQNNLTTLKSDAQTKVDVAMKQYSIDEQSYQDSLSKLNMLSSSGALAGATPQDLAGLSASTGLSTSMLSALSSNSKGANTYLTTATDSDGNLTVVAVDKNTGAIINKQTVGGVGKGSGGGAVSNNKNLAAQFNSDATSIQWVKGNGTNVGVFPQLVARYAPYMSLQDIYKNYANTPTGKKYGTPKESSTLVNAVYKQARAGAKDNGIGY